VVERGGGGGSRLVGAWGGVVKVPMAGRAGGAEANFFGRLLAAAIGGEWPAITARFNCLGRRRVLARGVKRPQRGRCAGSARGCSLAQGGHAGSPGGGERIDQGVSPGDRCANLVACQDMSKAAEAGDTTRPPLPVRGIPDPISSPATLCSGRQSRITAGPLKSPPPRPDGFGHAGPRGTAPPAAARALD